MGSIPLVANGIQQGTPPSALEAQQRFQAIQSAKTQQQLEQQQIDEGQIKLKDQQAMTQAMQSWDGKDFNELPSLVLKHGGSANAVIGLKQHILEQQTALANYNQKDLENIAATHKLQGSALQALDGVPDSELPMGILRAAQDPNNKFTPADQQAAFQLAQMPADQIRQHLPTLIKAKLGEQALADQAAKQSEAQKNTATATAETANAAKTQAEMEFYKAQGLAPGVTPEMASYADFIHGGGKPQDYKAAQAQKEGAATAPQKLALAKAEGAARFAIQQGTFGAQGDPMVDMVGQGRVDLATALQRVPPAAKNAFMTQLNSKYPGYDQATYGAEKKVLTDFTSGDAAKNLTAFNTAIQHANQLQQAADALDNGDVRGLNKVGNALGYQFGSDKTTNFNVIKNALSGEISKVFKGGQATDAEIREVQQPFDVANSPAQLKGAIQNAIHLMNSKRDALKQQYEAGRTGKPNFGGDTGSVSTSPTGGEVSATGPNGHKIVVRGGKWVDAQSGQPIQ